MNGNHVIKHIGGFTPFSADITEYLKEGENEIVVRCIDTLETAVPRGKQSWTGEQFTCYYYPNSGIWGSVWIEFFGVDCIENYSLQSDIDNRRVYGYIETLYGKADEAEIVLTFKNKRIKKQRISLDGKRTNYRITVEWQEIVNVAKNFTSVIAYVPLNESWGAREIKTNKSQQNFARSLYYLTKSLDDTRLVSTNDGFENIEESDILSIHDYDIKSAEEFPIKYNGNYDGMHPQGWALFADGHSYKGQPVLLT